MSARVAVLAAAVAVGGCGGSTSSLPHATSTGPGRTIYVLDDRGATIGARIVQTVISNDFSTVTFRSQIAGPKTGLTGPTSILRSPSGEIYVVQGDRPEIDVFDPSANGNVAPKRTIAGPATQLTGRASIGFDAAGNLYVAQFTPSLADPTTGITAAVLEFSGSANGNVAPIRVLHGQPGQLNEPSSVVVDAAGNVLVSDSLPNPNQITTGAFTTAVILRFAANAPGNAAAQAYVPASAGLNAPQVIGSAGPERIVTYHFEPFAASSFGLLDVTSPTMPTGVPLKSPELGNVANFVIDANDTIIACDLANHTVDFDDPTTGLVTQQISGSQLDSFVQPTGVSL